MNKITLFSPRKMYIHYLYGPTVVSEPKGRVKWENMDCVTDFLTTGNLAILAVSLIVL